MVPQLRILWVAALTRSIVSNGTCGDIRKMTVNWQQLCTNTIATTKVYMDGILEQKVIADAATKMRLKMRFINNW